MGMQDRDWYKEATAEKAKGSKRTKRKRGIPVDLLDNANPPNLWGADFHWTIKVLVWLVIFVLILAAIRLLR